MTSRPTRTWFRYCYRFPSWRHRIGWRDGFSRSHWMSDRNACETAISAVIARGGEAFLETQCDHIPMKAALDNSIGCIRCGKWLEAQ